MDNTVSTILIIVLILVVVFLILREVNCWYWKINERINLQKEQNSILEKILRELKNETNSPPKKATSRKKIEDATESEELISSSYNELTEKEQKRVNILINNLKKGSVITKHSVNKEIKIMTKKAYDSWVKYYGENSLIQIAKKE